MVQYLILSVVSLSADTYTYWYRYQPIPNIKIKVSASIGIGLYQISKSEYRQVVLVSVDTINFGIGRLLDSRYPRYYTVSINLYVIHHTSSQSFVKL